MRQKVRPTKVLYTYRIQLLLLAGLVLPIAAGQAATSPTDPSCLVLRDNGVSASKGLDAIYERIEVAGRRNKMRVIFAVGSTSEITRARNFFGNYGILVERVTKAEARKIIASPVRDEKGRFILFGVLTLTQGPSTFVRLKHDVEKNEYIAVTNQYRRSLGVLDFDLSLIARQYLIAEAQTDLVHTPQAHRRTIDFGNDWHTQYFAVNPWMQPLKGTYFEYLFHVVLNSGFFQKSPKSTRERMYWFPGLNAGATMTPKMDSLDEAVYAVHNMAHFLESDLIPLGLTNDRYKDIYIRHRVIGEAMTLVLSDMLFVEFMRRSFPDHHVPQEWVIGDLMHQFNIDPITFIKVDPYNGEIRLWELMLANVLWAVDGDESYWRKFFKRHAKPGADPKALDRYFAKYRSMFDGDIDWSMQNAEYFAQNEQKLQRWWEVSKAFQNLGRHVTVAEVEKITYHSGAELTRHIFNYVYREHIAPNLHKDPGLQTAGERRIVAVSRYLTGQTALLSEYVDDPKIADMIQQMRRLYWNLKPDQSVDQIEAIRTVYNQALEYLVSKGKISPDDQLLYQETYPLMRPVYVSAKYGLNGTQTEGFSPRDRLARFEDPYDLQTADEKTQKTFWEWLKKKPNEFNFYHSCMRRPGISLNTCVRYSYRQFLESHRQPQ